jgi:hypothetical protein
MTTKTKSGFEIKNSPQIHHRRWMHELIQWGGRGVAAVHRILHPLERRGQ